MNNPTKPDAALPAPATYAPPDISLVRGGLLYRLLVAIKLIDADHWNVGRRILLALAVVWLPMLLIRLVVDHSHITELLLDYRLNARVLAAVIFIAAEPLMDSRFRGLFQHIRESRLLVGHDLARMDQILASMRRLRDSILPELAILVVIVFRTATSYQFVGEQLIGDLAFRDPTGVHLTPAGWYAMLVSAPIVQFLGAVVLWRWLLWTIFAFRLSRLNLRLVPSHPDANGGLGFLSISTQAFVPFSFAISMVIGASFRNDILNHGKRLVNFEGPAVALVVILFAGAVLPLLFFVPKLLPLRRRGILNYSIIGHMQSSAFHEKWVTHLADNTEEDAIAAPEMSTLCDYNSAYNNVEDMNPVPVDKEALVGLLLSIAVPAIPVILAEIPLQTAVQDLLSALK